MKRYFINIYILFLAFPTIGQQYDDYIGAGHDINVTVTSSDAQADGNNTVSGEGLDLDIQGSSRFLAHATHGATIEEIEQLTTVGYESWINNQLNIPPTNYTTPTVEIIFEMYNNCQTLLGPILCLASFNIDATMWRYAYWNVTMRSPDKLRHKVTQALSEILVLSDRSDLGSYPHALAAYYDVLAQNAFGNYKDLLLDVTLNPSMGFYLSHFNNPKTVPLLNTSPDENYAREIMQLFSIGLYELNIDGSRKIDLTTGLWLPTYTNDDIKGLAKVFTGLSGSKWEDENNTEPIRFGRRFAAYSKIDPMAMYDLWHESGTKSFLGKTIPSGQSGMKDVEDAIDHLFNHPNVGPFLAARVIQRLVKSNPTPEYISRVASTFNNNGSGVRGDMAAVVKAILLDQEAMECYWAEDITSGTLRNPSQRLSEILIGLKADSPSERFWSHAFFYNELTGHHTLSSPTVFNFYRPDYVPDSDFAYLNFEGPEFQILNSSTSSNYVNGMLILFLRDYALEILKPFGVRPKDIPVLVNELYEKNMIFIANPESYIASLTDPLWLNLPAEEKVDYLDILLANGNLSDETKANIIASIKTPGLFDPISAAQYAAFMIAINPDFVIMK